ncbi:MAG TPA: phosphatidate cytidylyltransferase, partial [Thermodesulfobacteriota bacterium]|nr:phosphatidate cytidylyltransferase [Thermodesulfobacteriota bacterium]
MPMNNLTQRVLTAVVGVPLLCFIFYLGGVPFLILVLGIIFVGGLEFFKLLEIKRLSSGKWLGLLSSLILGIAAYYGYLWLGVFFMAAIFVIVFLQLRKQDLIDSITTIGTTLFGVIYLGWFLSHAILLRNIDHVPQIKSYAKGVQGLGDAGFFYLIFVVACTFLNDAGAYFVGKWKGKKKLIPRISPGKTVEGTVGGILFSTITGWIVNLVFRSPLEHHWALLFGLIIGIVALLGDLIESLIK